MFAEDLSTASGETLENPEKRVPKVQGRYLPNLSGKRTELFYISVFYFQEFS